MQKTQRAHYHIVSDNVNYVSKDFCSTNIDFYKYKKIYYFVTRCGYNKSDGISRYEKGEFNEIMNREEPCFLFEDLSGVSFFIFIMASKENELFNGGSSLRVTLNISELIELLLLYQLRGTLFHLQTKKKWVVGAPIAGSSYELDDFERRYDASKANTQFKEELLVELRDIYRKHNDPDTCPLFAKREEIWRSLSPSYRTYKQRVTHIDEIKKKCPGVDPTSVSKPISLDTINRTIQELER
jgi:hypothetical protein